MGKAFVVKIASNQRTKAEAFKNYKVNVAHSGYYVTYAAKYAFEAY
jgi:hypothetical protein